MNQHEQINQSLLEEPSSENQQNILLKLSQNKCQNSIIDGSSWYQTFLFSWVHPILSHGSKHSIQIDIMPKLPDQQKT